MAKLEYSSDAINTLNKFHRCDTVVYVEGDDDELFWSTIFDRCSELRVMTQAVGGADELDKFIERIVAEDLKVIAARDADFLTLLNRHNSDPRVIHTYGYSIENTIYTEKAINRLVKLWCKGKSGAGNADCREWLQRLHGELEKLTAYDAANFLFNCGVSVVGDNLARFAKKSEPHEVDAAKVSKHINTFCEIISDDMLKDVLNSEPLKNDRTIGSWVRGHFLASAVLQYITLQLKIVGLSTKVTYDGMYTSAMEHLAHNLDNGHPHYTHYCKSTKTALAAL